MKKTERKLLVGAAAVAALLVGFVICAIRPEAATAYATLAQWTVSLAGLYFTGNVAAKFAPKSTTGEPA